MILLQFRFREDNFLSEKEKVFAFLANSTPLIWRNECQKTFGEEPRIVSNAIHIFDILNTGRGYTCRCENFFNANER